MGVHRTQGAMLTTLNLSGPSDRTGGQASIGWGGFATQVERKRFMKPSLWRQIAYKMLKWWREMVGDLDQVECDVNHIASKLHVIAGRMHVLEMEAYGETRPRSTLPPPPVGPSPRVH